MRPSARSFVGALSGKAGLTLPVVEVATEAPARRRRAPEKGMQWRFELVTYEVFKELMGDQFGRERLRGADGSLSLSAVYREVLSYIRGSEVTM